jgi:hypothetical protein
MENQATVPQLSTLWRTPIGGAPSGAVLNAAGDTLYLAANDGFAYALDAFNGGVVWRSALTAPSSCTPVLLQGLVVIISTDSTVNVFGAANGTLVNNTLNFNDAPFTECAPVWDEHSSSFVIVANRASNKVWAIDPSTWTAPAGWLAAYGNSDATLVGDGTFIVGNNGGGMIQYNCIDGSPAGFGFNSNSDATNQPLVMRGSVLFTSPGGFYNVDLKTATQVWWKQGLVSTYSNAMSTPSGAGVVLGTDVGTVVAVDPFTQNLQWTVNLTNGGKAVATTPVFAGEGYIVGDETGVVYAITTEGVITAQVNLSVRAAFHTAMPVSRVFGAVYAAVGGDGTAGAVVALSHSGATFPPMPTVVPAGGIVENVCFTAGCSSACGQVSFAPNTCVATSASTSMLRTCNSTAMTRTTFGASTTCGAGASALEVFIIGACYAQADGTYASVVSCPTQ